MRLYRRDHLYLACDTFDAGFVYDASDGNVKNVIIGLYLGAEARLWLPVLESEAIPDGLERLFLLKMPAPPT